VGSTPPNLWVLRQAWPVPQGQRVLRTPHERTNHHPVRVGPTDRRTRADYFLTYTTIVDGIIPARFAAAANSPENELWAAWKGLHVRHVPGAGDLIAPIHVDVAGSVGRDRRHGGDHVCLELQPLLDIVDRCGDDNLGYDEPPSGRREAVRTSRAPTGSGRKYPPPTDQPPTRGRASISSEKGDGDMPSRRDRSVAGDTDT
jgi:hypothetical protein